MSTNKRGSWHSRDGIKYGPNGRPYFRKNTNPEPTNSTNNQQNIDNLLESKTSPYKGWKLYFTTESNFKVVFSIFWE